MALCYKMLFVATTRESIPQSRVGSSHIYFNKRNFEREMERKTNAPRVSARASAITLQGTRIRGRGNS
jgi:hypothetical protein